MIDLAVAWIISISCGPSWARALYCRSRQWTESELRHIYLATAPGQTQQGWAKRWALGNLLDHRCKRVLHKFASMVSKRSTPPVALSSGDGGVGIKIHINLEGTLLKEFVSLRNSSSFNSRRLVIRGCKVRRLTLDMRTILSRAFRLPEKDQLFPFPLFHSES